MVSNFKIMEQLYEGLAPQRAGWEERGDSRGNSVEYQEIPLKSYRNLMTHFSRKLSLPPL